MDNTMEHYKLVVDCLNIYRERSKDKYGIFFLGVQLDIGKTKLYRHYHTAKRKVVEQTIWHLPASTATSNLYKCGEEVIDKLEKSGLLEIKKLGDRSARFPYNLTEISKEQADKFVSMLDASDREIVNMAVTILEKIKIQENEEDDSENQENENG